MSKTLLYWIVGLIIIVGGGWYFFMGSGGAGAPSGSAQQSNSSAPTSLASLVASGVAQKCTFTDSTDAANTSGTVYVSGGKMRGDFTAVVNGATTQAHMIGDGTNMYTWVDGMTTGFKAAVNAQASVSGGGQTSQQGLDAKKNLDYKCSPGGVDASMFTLPSGVTFNDLSAMMQGASVTTGTGAGTGTGASAGSSAANCAMCDQAGSGRDQCRAALGCK